LLGKFLIPKLTPNHNVGVCDKLVGHMSYTLPNSITLFTADVTDLNSTRQVFRRFEPDVVIVSVAHHFNKDTVYSQYDDVGLVYRSSNVVASLLTSQVKKVIFCSSSEVYGGPQTPKLVSEVRKIKIPATQHGVAKLSAEALLKFRCDELDISFSALRIFDMYGPRTTFCPRTGMVNFLIDTFQEGKKTVGLSGATRGRDFIHASDVAEVVAFAVDNDLSGLYNVGTGKRTTLIGLVKLLAKTLDISIPPVIMPDGPVTTFSAVANINLLKLHIPTWEPKDICTSTLQDIIKMRVTKAVSNESRLAEFKRERGI